jgi:hypothetical protein
LETFLKIDPAMRSPTTTCSRRHRARSATTGSSGASARRRPRARMFVAAAQKPELSAMIAVNLAGTISFVALFADDTGNRARRRTRARCNGRCWTSRSRRAGGFVRAPCGAAADRALRGQSAILGRR